MIEFGDWQIRQHDKLNLTLFHRHVKRRRDGETGEATWNPTGNYFQSVDGAVMFALRRDARDAVGDADERIEMAEYAQRVKKLVDGYSEWLSEARINW